MTSPRYTFFVEGKDDRRFLERIIIRELDLKYCRIIEYSQLKPEKVNAFFEAELQGKRVCIFLCDKDDEPCFTQKKNRIVTRYEKVDSKCILIAERQIDCWYFSGLDRGACKKMKIDIRDCTGTKTKPEWQACIEKTGRYRNDFLVEMTECYVLGYALEKNRSLKYCVDRIAAIESAV